MPVMISRSGRCPWRTRRRRPASVLRSEITDLRLNGLCQQGTCPAAQNLGERIREGPWLRKLENVSVDHGVSLLRWRSGGVEHPHDTPPYPFMPSPTFAHSSIIPRSSGYRRCPVETGCTSVTLCILTIFA